MVLVKCKYHWCLIHHILIQSGSRVGLTTVWMESLVWRWQVSQISWQELIIYWLLSKGIQISFVSLLSMLSDIPISYNLLFLKCSIGNTNRSFLSETASFVPGKGRFSLLNVYRYNSILLISYLQIENHGLWVKIIWKFPENNRINLKGKSLAMPNLNSCQIMRSWHTHDFCTVRTAKINA